MDKIKRTLSGEVTKKSSQNTIKVKVTIKRPHPLYGKVVTSHKSYLVDCTNEQFEDVEIGNKVQIMETRPISKRKSWKLEKIAK